MSDTTETLARLRSEVDELWDKQKENTTKIAVIESHLLNISRSLESINSHVSKFVWAVAAVLLSALMGLILR